MQRRITLIKALTILVTALLVSGCSTKLTDFTLLATKNADFSRLSEFQKGNRPGQGANTLYIILFLPTEEQPMKEAIDRAMASVPGCAALADGAIYLQNYYWLLAAGAVRYVVEATPVIDPKLKAELPSPYILVAYDETRKQYIPHYLSPDEYNKVREASGAGAAGGGKF